MSSIGISAIPQSIFVATSTVPFSNDAQLGSITEPYTPDWKVME